MDPFIDWLIDWLVDRLIVRLIDWLIDWLIDCSVDWLILWLVDWLVGWLIDCSRCTFFFSYNFWVVLVFLLFFLCSFKAGVTEVVAPRKNRPPLPHPDSSRNSEINSGVSDELSNFPVLTQLYRNIFSTLQRLRVCFLSSLAIPTLDAINRLLAETSAVIERLSAERQVSSELEHAYSDLFIPAVEKARDGLCSQQEAARLLGVSLQRIGQLLPSPRNLRENHVHSVTSNGHGEIPVHNDTSTWKVFHFAEDDSLKYLKLFSIGAQCTVHSAQAKNATAPVQGADEKHKVPLSVKMYENTADLSVLWKRLESRKKFTAEKCSQLLAPDFHHGMFNVTFALDQAQFQVSPAWLRIGADALESAIRSAMRRLNEEEWDGRNKNKAKSLSSNEGVLMASRRGQILLAVSFSKRVLPMRLATVSTRGICFVLHSPAVFGHFLDPPGNHPRGAIFPTVD